MYNIYELAETKVKGGEIQNEETSTQSNKRKGGKRIEKNEKKQAE